MIAPPQQRAPDAFEAASRRARAVLGGATRERPAPQERPPFDSVSRGRSTEHTGPDCWACAEGRRREAARPDVSHGELVRQDPRYLPAPACSDCGYVSCQCGVAGAYVPVRAGTPAAVYP